MMLCTPKRSKIPPKRTLFGVKEAPPLPSFEKRANYVVSGIMKGAIEALADLHESGIAHRSIGRSSVILTSPTQDKAEPSSVYATRPDLLSIKLADFGFSGLLEESTYDDEFLLRARSFGLSFRKGDTSSLAATNFAVRFIIKSKHCSCIIHDPVLISLLVLFLFLNFT